MKLLMLANLSLLLLCFGAANNTPWPLTLLQFSFFSLLPLLPLLLLVPGGFAWRKHSHSTPKLVGPTGWPFLGSLPQMGSLAHRKLASMAASLGATGLMAFSLGATRVIVASRPETAREILSGPSFSDRPVKESARALMFERAIGFAPSGSYWRGLRRVAARHMFSPRRVSELEGVRQHAADEMVDGVWREMRERGIVGVRGIVGEGSLSNIIESVFGMGLCEEIRAKLGSMVRQGSGLITKLNLADHFFSLALLDFYGVKRRCDELAVEVNGIVSQIIRERAEGEFRARSDFLSILLALPREEQLSHTDMVAVLWEMIFRGTDPVAVLLEWIMARVVLHQDVQAKAQQEIDTCIGRGSHVRDWDILRLPYLRAIVKEALRLHPPGPLLSWARLAVHDVHIGKFFVPAGTTAMVNMWAITHDPSIWKDPWAFKPERFTEEDAPIMGSDLRLAPFGSGCRVCPGRALGLATVQLWLARFLHEFRWLPASDQPVDLSESLQLSLEMKKPLLCRVARRFS